MTTDLDRTTAAVLAADQAHLARMQDETTSGRARLLGRLSNGDRIAFSTRQRAARLLPPR